MPKISSQPYSGPAASQSHPSVPAAQPQGGTSSTAMGTFTVAPGAIGLLPARPARASRALSGLLAPTRLHPSKRDTENLQKQATLRLAMTRTISNALATIGDEKLSEKTRWQSVELLLNNFRLLNLDQRTLVLDSAVAAVPVDENSGETVVDLIRRTDDDAHPLSNEFRTRFLSAAFQRAVDIFFPTDDAQLDIDEAEDQSLLKVCEEICWHLPPAGGASVLEGLLRDVDRTAFPEHALDTILQASAKVPLEDRAWLYAKMVEPMVEAPTTDDGAGLLHDLSEAVASLTPELKASFLDALPTPPEGAETASGLLASPEKLQRWVNTLRSSAE